ncbi:signal peptidase II [Deinococcus yunweiensis]|uniref:signal peptidase II n=1 Tax=Deinococcus yunweiensis TaxID=367282 RepID=UPI00398EAB66
MPLSVRHYGMALLLLGLLLLDLALKNWAVQTRPGAAPQALIPGLLALDYTLNTGMAWSVRVEAGILGVLVWATWA